MLLTDEWKKLIIPLTIQNIFTGFSDQHYYQKLSILVEKINRDQYSDYIGFYYKNDHVIPYQNFGKVVLYKMTETSLYWDEFNEIISLKLDYKQQHKKAINYVTNGMVLCQTTQDLEYVFPQIVLDAISTQHNRCKGEPVLNLSHNPNSDVRRVINFKKNSALIENELAKHQFRSLLKPGN